MITSLREKQTRYRGFVEATGDAADEKSKVIIQ